MVINGADLGRMERRSVSLMALPSPEWFAAHKGGGGGGGTGGGGGATGAAGSAAGTADSESPTDPSGGAHDNGWHNGNNPNGFAIDHDDKSQDKGNNHH